MRAHEVHKNWAGIMWRFARLPNRRQTVRDAQDRLRPAQPTGIQEKSTCKDVANNVTKAAAIQLE